MCMPASNDSLFSLNTTVRKAACVSLLLSQGCDLSQTDNNYFTAAAHALAFDHISVVQILPITAFFTENLNPKIFSPFPESVVNNQMEKIIDTENDAHVNECSKNDKAMIAVDSSVEISMEFDTKNEKSEKINIEVEVEVPRVISRSALHIICQWGSIKCLDYFMALGSKEIKNTNISSGEVVEYWTGDDFNTKNENDNGTTVNHFPVNFSLSDGTTALHVAARYGHLSCLKKLIEVGSDFRIVDIHGNTPLLLSRKWGRTECENYLSGLQDACTFA